MIDVQLTPRRFLWISAGVVAAGALVVALVVWLRPQAARPAEAEGTLVSRFGRWEARRFRQVDEIAEDAPNVVGNWYQVVDVSTQKPVTLDSLFPEGAVVQAITDAIPKDEFEGKPSTAKELQTQLEKMPASLLFATENCEELWKLDPKTQDFAPIAYDAVSGRTTLHLSIPAHAHACNAGFPRVRLQVDTPQELRAYLRKGFFAPPEALKACDTCDPIDSAEISISGA